MEFTGKEFKDINNGRTFVLLTGKDYIKYDKQYMYLHDNTEELIDDYYTCFYKIDYNAIIICDIHKMHKYFIFKDNTCAEFYHIVDIPDDALICVKENEIRINKCKISYGYKINTYYDNEYTLLQQIIVYNPSFSRYIKSRDYAIELIKYVSDKKKYMECLPKYHYCDDLFNLL